MGKYDKQGEALRNLRKQLGYKSAKTVSNELGYSRNWLYEKEHGRKGLTLTEALELSEYYKVPLQYLVDKIGGVWWHIIRHTKKQAFLSL